MSHLQRLIGVLFSAAFIFACGPGDENPPQDPNPGPTPTYSVGGTITGYTGSGLRLVNNISDLRSVANTEASFSFTNELNDGDTYNVVVNTQPGSPVQQCVVNNASGAINGADVSNVDVVCTTTQFNVNLNLINYSGEGLIVTHNAVDYPIAAGSTSFQLPTALDDLTSVSMTITANPTNPDQTCQGASGTINGQDLQLNIVCTTPNTSSWSAPLPLASNVTSEGPYLLSDGNGNSLAIWQQDNTTLIARHYVAGTGWGAPQIISNVGPGLGLIAFDMAANGDAIVIWRHFNATQTDDFYMNSFDLTNGWGTATALGFNPQVIDGIDRSKQMLAVNSNNQALMVWRTTTNTLARYWNNGAWSSEMNLATRSRREGGVAAAIAENGNAAALWDDNFSLFASHYTQAGGWEMNQNLGGRTNFDVATFAPHVRMDSNNLPVAVWLGNGVGPVMQSPYESRYTPANGWTASSPIHLDRNCQDVDFVIGSNDNLHVVTDSITDLFGSSNLNGIWTDADNISDSQATEIMDFSDTVDLASRAGTTIAIWEGYYSTTRRIWTSVYDPANGWGQATPIDTSSGLDEADHPQVAIDGMNQATAVWRQWNNTDQQWDLYFSRYE